ncbi:LysE family translocator [Oceanimonas smirnovii]|uniref:LysE family translocator n=1 Tax=Oceanimonas smirnovii TaxID=264574 RepID=A0ABW7NXV6_9GAMM
MVEILMYAFGIMYTPGPVNLLSLNAGLNGQAKKMLPFCIGVGMAMFLLFFLFGYSGAFLPSELQTVIGLFGGLYILWLAFKIGNTAIRPVTPAKADKSQEEKGVLSFRSGLLMQLCNPKAPVAILPIVTVQFPAVGISGAGIAVWSVLLGGMALGAPSCYLLLGTHVGKLIRTPVLFRIFNALMALILVYVGCNIVSAQTELLRSM